jgi:glyoxylase-like metal-dependent hydrolase (beta-lactamase superfamily II)/rhodanese-related sulfurtransferase
MVDPAGRGPRATPSVIDPGQLRSLLEGPDPPLLVDVRSDRERRIARIPEDRWIPSDALADRATELDPGRRILLYDHGGTASRHAAELLAQRGFDRVSILGGGIDGYAKRIDPTIPRYRDPPGEAFAIQQFPNLSSGCLAYLVRDLASGEAIAIDPGRGVEPLLRALSEGGLRLRAIVETHTHADHLSGHAILHERTGAPILVSNRSPAQYPHRSLSEDEGVPFGGSELAVWETPGHTLDHLSLRLEGAVFTGDTLLPGSCGRTDLGDGDPTQLWESLTGKLLSLSDGTEVFPAHYGPLHGLPPPFRYSSSMGFERQANEALRQPSLSAFLQYMREGWPPKPDSFDAIVRENLAH